MNIQGRELCLHDLLKIYLKHWPLFTYEVIGFKLNVMVEITKLYCLISDGMTLTFTQGHRVTGKLELMKYFCCEVV